MNFHAVSLQFRMYWKTKYFRFHTFGFLDILHKLYTCIRPWGDAFWLCDFENVLSWWSNRDSRDTCNLSLSPLPQTWALWEDFGASMLPELCPFTSEVLNLGFFCGNFSWIYCEVLSQIAVYALKWGRNPRKGFLDPPPLHQKISRKIPFYFILC